MFFDAEDRVEWVEEQGFVGWNCYRGDLEILRLTGVYTQEPGSNDLAGRDCGLSEPWSADSLTPATGRCAFFLISGIAGGGEGGLGEDGDGLPRPNDNPCP